MISLVSFEYLSSILLYPLALRSTIELILTGLPHQGLLKLQMIKSLLLCQSAKAKALFL
jgi:hypothetical protein